MTKAKVMNDYALSDVPGATLLTEFITKDEQGALMERINRYTATPDSVVGEYGNRRFTYFHDEDTPQALYDVMERVEKAVGLTERQRFGEMFANHYSRGFTLSAHFDGQTMATGGLANLTVLGGCAFTLAPGGDLAVARKGQGQYVGNIDGMWQDRENAPRCTFWFPPRALLVLKDDAALKWGHGFDCLPRDRMSIIFRQVREKRED